MTDLLAALSVLVHDPTARSRNRHFDEFQDPGRRHLRRLAAFLIRLREEILSLPPGAIEVVHGSFARGTVRLRYRRPSLRIARTAFLSDGEWALLCEDPAVVAKCRSL